MVAKEIISSISKYDPNQNCPTCGKKMRRIYDIPNIKFKGKGFYCTDYPKSVDKKTQERLMKNEFKEMQNEAYKQIEEDEEEPYEGFMYKDKNGNTKFVDEKDVSTTGDRVNIKGKQYKVAE
jgi:predicted nucleic acid-binding Zn ribbon protein